MFLRSGEDSSIGAPLARAAEFITDFVRYSGKKGIVATICVGLGAVVEGLGLALLVPLLAVVLDNGRKGGTFAIVTHVFAMAHIDTRFGKLAILLSFFVALLIVRAIILSVRDVTLAELQIGFVEAERLRLTRLLVAARWDTISKLRHNRVAHVMSSDIPNIGAMANVVVHGAISVAVLISQCVLVLVLSPYLAILAFALLAVGGLALGPAMRYARDMGLLVSNANFFLMNSTTKFLAGIKLAVSQNLQDRFLEEFQSTSRNLKERRIAFTRQRTNMRLAIGVFTGFAAAFAVLIGFGVMNIAPSLLLAELFVLTRMSGPMQQIQQGAQQFATGLPAYERAKALEKELLSANLQDIASEPAADVPQGPIEFRAVSFSHNAETQSADGTRVLRDASIAIAPGSIVGIGGASGAGKTTFADLLIGLFPPQAGEILVGGVPLRGPALNAWRNGVSYVSQDLFLFHDTIRNNLLWAVSHASEDDLWRALSLFGVDNLVRRLPQGLDTIIGERGALLSGGERQRLALARAILRRPRLLVLDEATNALDIAGEHEILQRLAALEPRPTIVMIAHRIESLRLCDRVLTLEAGRFVELPEQRTK